MGDLAKKLAAVPILAIGCAGPSPSTGGDDAAVADAAGVDAFVPDATPRACGPARQGGHQRFDCPDGVGIDVEVPVACVDGGCGVVLDVHGYTMSADIQDSHTRMRTLGAERGYVVVQPSAPGSVPSWGIGEHDDVVWDALQATIERFAIDRDRVHVTGFSQGGMMSFRQLCAHADEIASIAPVAGGGCFVGDAPAVERPILYIHGHWDQVVSWTGVAVPQRQAILDTWDFSEGVEIDASATHVATRYVTPSGTAFEMWEHDLVTGDVLAGHCIPGPDDDGTFRCDASPFDEATLVLDFFDGHPRR